VTSSDGLYIVMRTRKAFFLRIEYKVLGPYSVTLQTDAQLIFGPNGSSNKDVLIKHAVAS
jgi:hypothetical protein